MHSILSSSFLRHYNEMKHYEDLSKYATLAIWTTGAENTSITDLIGEAPVMKDSIEEVDRELTEDELEWIKFAEENNLTYKITENGVKLG